MINKNSIVIRLVCLTLCLGMLASGFTPAVVQAEASISEEVLFVESHPNNFETDEENEVKNYDTDEEHELKNFEADEEHELKNSSPHHHIRHHEHINEVELTKKQQKEIDRHVKKAIKAKKKVIKKYIKFGVFDEEYGEKLLQHIDKKYEKMKENGFQPCCMYNHHHHHKGEEREHSHEGEQQRLHEESSE